MKVPLRATVNLGFALALTILFIVGIAAYQTTSGLIALGQEISHTQAIESNLEAVLALMTDAETGQRGFLLTGNESYLAPYNHAMTTIGQHMAELRALMADNPDDQRKLDTLQGLISEKFTELRTTIALRKSQGIEAALPIVQTNRGKQTMDSIRSVIRSLEENQNTILVRRNAELATDAQRTITIIVIGSILAIVSVGAAIYFSNNGIGARERAHDERNQLLAREQAARAEAEIERARFQTILDGAANAIIYVDSDTGHIFANPAAKRLFGHALVPESGVSQYLNQLRRPDDVTITMDQLSSQRALRGETVTEEEMVIVTPDGRQIPVLESAAPVSGPDGRVVGAVVVIQDISALKNLERLRDEWTSIIAHDLRQPVTLVLGYGGIMSKSAEQLPAEIKRAIENILVSSRRLNRMIGDLLDASRLEARRLRLVRAEVDVIALTNEIVERLATIADARPVRIVASDNIPRVRIDPQRFEQILGNLVSNAVKYGAPNTEVVIALERQEASVKVAVANHGGGITPDRLAGLFTRFHRIQPSGHDQRVDGLGLGLYITKGLVEAHGGGIWAESVPDEITTISFTLPLETGDG